MTIKKMQHLDSAERPKSIDRPLFDPKQVGLTSNLQKFGETPTLA